MPSPHLRLAYLLMVALLAGCPAPPRTNSGYPAEITGVGDSPNSPLQVGAYRRGKMYMYEPGMKNHSIAYDRYDSTLQNAVTLCFYPMSRSLEEQFAAEKREVLRFHTGGSLLNERSATFTKNGVAFRGYIATFRFDEAFAYRQQAVSSQLVLIALPGRAFKVRSSASASQAAEAEASLFELLERLNWAP